MSIGVTGFDFHRTAIDLREQLAFPPETLLAVYETLRTHPALAEVVVLSTCNRTEVYFSTAPAATPADAAAAIETLFSAAAADTASAFAPYLYHQSGKEAITHLFQVVAGLHSMVIGESQIIGQARDAFAQAKAANAVRDELSQLFTAALKVGKRARAGTSIGRADTSVSTACLDLIKSVLPQLEGCRVALVGAGKISRLCAGLLRQAGAGSLVFANRTAAVATSLAVEFGGTTIPLRDLPRHLGAVDLVISATGAPHFIISAVDLAQATGNRQTPLYLFDLALPRDIDPKAAQLPLVRLYDLDTLAPYGFANTHTADLAKMRTIVEAGIEDFLRWQAARRAVPAISALRRDIDTVEAHELENTLAQLSHLSEDDQETVRQFGGRLADKIFYELVTRIKSAAATPETEHYLEAIQHLFAVSPDENRRRRL